MDSFCSLSDRDGNDPRSAPSSADLTKTSPINNLVVVVLVLLQPPITTVEAAVNASNDAVRGMVCIESVRSGARMGRAQC
jgi:hypothetical protein